MRALVEVEAEAVPIVVQTRLRVLAASAETGWAWQERDFPALDMSGMTDTFAEILERRSAALPTYEESAKDHLALLAVYNRHWFGAAANGATCPIT